MPCQGELTVVQGQVHACLIRDLQSTRVVVEGKPALDCLQQCDQLSWRVQPKHQDTSQLPFHTSNTGYEEMSSTQRHSQERWFLSPPPRLTRHLETSEMEKLPHKHRQVLLLVNGQRGVEDVRRMLNCSPEQLLPVLDELEASNLITLSNPRKSPGR